MDIISAETPDWSREKKGVFQWDPGRSFLAAIRRYQRHQQKKGLINVTLRSGAVLMHRFWGVVCGADIPVNCRLGGGLLLPHPNGIVIHPEAVLGPNCLIFQQVTIGAGSRSGLPVIGGHVDIGAGAKVLGGVTVGHHARIGANAVVVDDVPAGATVVGVPARVIRP